MTLSIFTGDAKPYVVSGFYSVEALRLIAHRKAKTDDDLYVIQDESYIVVEFGFISSINVANDNLL